MTFESWMDKVDDEFIGTVGLSRDCWPDQDYWSMWESGYTPNEAVAAAIENEYGEEGLEAFGLGGE